MERQAGPTGVTSTTTLAKPDGKRFRRKLQKGGNIPRSPHTKTSFARIPAPVSDRTNQYDNGRTVPRTQPSLPLPPDLSDSKWLEYIRTSGYLCEMDRPPMQVNPASEWRPRVVPELAHLAISDDNSSRKPSLEQPPSESSVSTSSTQSSSRRRHAKTPVLAIGQLEGLAARRAAAAQKVSSVELIAEQYRALLDSRSMMYEDSISEPTEFQSADDALSVKPHHSADDLPVVHEVAQKAVPMPSYSPEMMLGSPASDGTLVAFEEDAIYFKPVSFSPEPSPTSQNYDYASMSATPPAVSAPTTSPGLQICFDLLIRELSAAVSGQSQRPDAETSALQIYVMIEAYERLQDQIKTMGLAPEYVKMMDIMLDTWLRALSSVHEKMTGNDGRRSESVYDQLESEAVD